MTSSAHSSTASLVSVDAKGCQVKDYAAAFGALQSTYGLSAAPVVAPPASRKTTPAPVTVALPPRSTGAKDYEAAFGALQSSYGLAGAPAIPATSARKAKAPKRAPKTAAREDKVGAKEPALAALLKKVGLAGGLRGRFSMHSSAR
jgi:hypothetical protein